MPRTIAQLKNRLAKLKAQASLTREAIERIRATVLEHQLTAADIFPEGWPPHGEPRKPEPPTVSLAPEATAARYSDNAGNSWAGIGRRPTWLVQALADGAELEDFLVKPAAKRTQKVTKSATTNLASSAPYRNAEGQEWTGRGRRPNWLLAALEQGAQLEDFRV